MTVAVQKVRLRRFTAFSDLEVEFGVGLHVLIGANGSGKTHLLKVMYAACSVTRDRSSFAEKLVRVLQPLDDSIGRLVHREGKSTDAKLRVSREGAWIQASFTNHTKQPGADNSKERNWTSMPTESTYIPAKEMLAHAPGFRSLYNSRQISFEETYADLIDRAYLPLRRGAPDEKRRRLLKILERNMTGKVTLKGETFFLKNAQGNLEFSLLGEGLRKLALLWLLIQNGSLQSGAVLFWDEPEANLNPAMMCSIAEILIELQRSGVQVFVATHDYVLLKELDLLSTAKDKVRYHALYRDPKANKEIRHHSAPSYLDLHENAILDTFGDLFDRDVERALRAEATV